MSTNGGMILHKRCDGVTEIDAGSDVEVAYCEYCVNHGDYALEFHELQIFVEDGPDIMYRPDPPPPVITSSLTGTIYVWYHAKLAKHGHYMSLENLLAYAKTSTEARDRLIAVGLYPAVAPGTNGNGHKH